MQKILKLIGLLLEFLRTWRGKPVADVKDENIRTVKAGLVLADQNDPAVANARHRLEQIEALPEKEREARASEVKEMEALVEEKAKAVVPKDKKNVLKEIQAAEAAKRKKNS